MNTKKGIKGFISLPLEERFWEKVDKNGPIYEPLGSRCWVWIASKGRGGYGQIEIQRGKSPMHSNRLAWELTNGPIPNGLHVLHICDNPPCCNPEHLFLGTNLDNQRDMMKKGRRNPPAGVRSHSAKLTWEQVEEIRKLWSEEHLRKADLAYMFGVHCSQISRIINGKTWKIQR
jgi:hypothetical protein